MPSGMSETHSARTSSASSPQAYPYTPSGTSRAWILIFSMMFSWIPACLKNFINYKKWRPGPDWLKASFIFYDENAQPVHVYVKGCLETKKLSYVYKDVEIPWLKTKPTPRKSKVKKVATLFPLGRGGVARTCG
jgi:hypothetical protein